MKRLIFGIVVLSFLAGCTRAPDLIPRLILQGEPVGEDFWLAAPYVVVAKIVRADPQGPRQPAFRGGPKDLQLVKFVANVENVIKGELPDKTIGFFFFVNLGLKPRYYLDPGRRYIVSLRREGGILRSWADASQLMIEVFSGSHAQKDLPLAPPPREPVSNIPERLPPDVGPEATIAYILLTPGADCDLNMYAENLFRVRNRYGDRRYVNRLLKQLERHPHRKLRESACLAEADEFEYLRPKCLEQCLGSPDAGIRRDAERRLKEKDEVNLSGRLRHNVLSLFPTPWTDYMTQMFEIYAEDIRPEVREAACANLRNFAPQQAAEYCKGPK